MHLASAHDLVFADDGDVVFRLAGDNAGVATVAAVEVDGHRPFVAVVGEFGLAVVEGKFLGRGLLEFMNEIRILAVFVQSAGNQDVPAFHVEVVLRAGERVIITRFSDYAPRCIRGPESVRGTYGIGVEAFVRASVTGFLATIAKRQNHNVFGLTRQNPRGCGDLASGKRNINDVREDLTMLAAARRDTVSELGDGLGQFLEPAVIRKAAIVNAGVGPE